MQSIQTVLNHQPSVDNKVLSSKGFCIWLCWSNGPEAKIQSILEDSGGLEVVATTQQSLWFFFSVDAILYSLAKIDVWGKQYSIGATAFTFPCDLIVGAERAISLDIAPEFQQMTAEDPNTTMFIVAHPSIWPSVATLPGVSCYAMTELEKQGLFDWKIITADRQLPFSVELGWFAFLHPLGNPIDKQYQRGWNKIFSTIEPLMEEQKIKYSLQNGFLSVALTTISQMKAWMQAVLVVFEDIREYHQDLYWPCVCLVVDKKNMNFTPDIHEKLGVDWNTLSPDTPHLSYKNAFFLGKRFTVRDINFSSTTNDINVFCTVSLKDFEKTHPTLSPIIAKALTPGKESCFYCGSGSHKPSQCPSKYINPIPPTFWKKFNYFDFEELNGAYRTIDEEINEYGMPAYSSLLQKGGATGHVLTATFAINAPCQVPNIERIWNISSRDMEENPEIPPSVLKDPAYLILQRLRAGAQDLNAIERDCTAQVNKNPKIWQLHCLRGFVAMEKGDYSQATAAWKEAESICTTTHHQAWFKYLVGRLREVQGFFLDAFNLYTAARTLIPDWRDIEYRILVTRVKLGFGQVVTQSFTEHVKKSPEIFHKIILDPELIRGHHHINKQLFPLWEIAYKHFEDDYKKLGTLLETLLDWFGDTPDPVMKHAETLRTFLDYGHIKNYLLFLDVAEFRPICEVELVTAIEAIVAELKNQYELCLNQVEYVRDEMNWFHFQRSLIDFNSTFNDCARILNWAFVSNFKEAKTFKEAKEKLPELQGLVDKLRGKLKKLRLVRDITLFTLLTLRTFLRIGSITAILVLIGIFLFLFFGDHVVPGISRTARENFWPILNGSMWLTLVFSLAIGSLKTTVQFDGKREELLKEAKQERVKAQKQRIARAKEIREEQMRQMKREHAQKEANQLKAAREAEFMKEGSNPESMG